MYRRAYMSIFFYICIDVRMLICSVLFYIFFLQEFFLFKIRLLLIPLTVLSVNVCCDVAVLLLEDIMDNTH